MKFGAIHQRDGEANELDFNVVGTISLRLSQPLAVDTYATHRANEPSSSSTPRAGRRWALVLSGGPTVPRTRSEDPAPSCDLQLTRR